MTTYFIACNLTKQNSLTTERRKPNHFWQNVQNCRNFFDQVAAERGIDSLSAKEWYSVDLHQLRGKSVCLCAAVVGC